MVAKAEAAAQKALLLDPTLSEAHAALGVVRFFLEWKWSAAEEEFRRALELNRNVPNGRIGYGWLLMTLGRSEEAVVQLEQALALDPLSADAMTMLGIAHAWRDEPEAAIAELVQALEINPANHLAASTLAGSYCRRGSFEAAKAVLDRATALAPHDPALLTSLAVCSVGSGNREVAFQQLAELEERAATRFVSPTALAEIYVVLDRPDRAFEELEKAYRMHWPLLPIIKANPAFDPLRPDPRFQNLLRRLGLAES